MAGCSSRVGGNVDCARCHRWWRALSGRPGTVASSRSCLGSKGPRSCPRDMAVWLRGRLPTVVRVRERRLRLTLPSSWLHEVAPLGGDTVQSIGRDARFEPRGWFRMCRLRVVQRGAGRRLPHERSTRWAAYVGPVQQRGSRVTAQKEVSPRVGRWKCGTVSTRVVCVPTVRLRLVAGGEKRFGAYGPRGRELRLSAASERQHL